MKFEWDEAKNKANYAKHGISFEIAKRVFDDPLVIYAFDRVVDGKERWKAIGKIVDLPIMIVIYTERINYRNEEITRIISARQATSHERRNYENG